MIDLGRGAYPSFHDFDGDGLLDLAVANKERYEGVDQTPAAVAVFRNVGTFAIRTCSSMLVDLELDRPGGLTKSKALAQPLAIWMATVTWMSLWETSSVASTNSPTSPLQVRGRNSL